MRYYVEFNKDGTLRSFMEYEHFNTTMTEVSEAEYKKILRENGLEPETAPPEYTETQLMGQQLTDLELLVLDHINAGQTEI